MEGVLVLMFVGPLIGFGALGLSVLRRFLAGDFVNIDLTQQVEDRR
jgi:hypothetical protein